MCLIFIYVTDCGAVLLPCCRATLTSISLREKTDLATWRSLGVFTTIQGCCVCKPRLCVFPALPLFLHARRILYNWWAAALPLWIILLAAVSKCGLHAKT